MRARGRTNAAPPSLNTKLLEKISALATDLATAVGMAFATALVRALGMALAMALATALAMALAMALATALVTEMTARKVQSCRLFLASRPLAWTTSHATKKGINKQRLLFSMLLALALNWDCFHPKNGWVETVPVECQGRQH